MTALKTTIAAAALLSALTAPPVFAQAAIQFGRGLQHTPQPGEGFSLRRSQREPAADGVQYMGIHTAPSGMAWA